jgi:hypothetical protein
MPSRNITVPVSDCSPEAIGRTREPETGNVSVTFQFPQGRISLVNSGKQPDYLLSPPVVGYPCQALEWPPFQEALEALVW